MPQIMCWNNYLFFHIVAYLVKCGGQGEDGYSKIRFLPGTASLDFNTAVHYCEAKGARLPSLSLTNTSIYKRMVQKAHSISMNSFWLGLRKWQIGKFLDLNNRYPTTDLQSVHGSCGIFDIFNPMPVRAIECRLLYPGYICKSPYDHADCRNMNGFTNLATGCFFISKDPGNWFTARNACQRKGLELAYFDSKQEKADILHFLMGNKTLSNKNKFYWIGLRRMDYMFIYALNSTSGSGFSNLAYWKNGQPKNDNKTLCVLATKTNKGYNWTVESCFSVHPVICEAAISINESSLGTSTEQFMTITSDELMIPSRNISKEDELPMQHYAMPVWAIILISLVTVVVLIVSIVIIVFRVRVLKKRKKLRRAGYVDNKCIIELNSDENHPLITQQDKQSEKMPDYNILLVGVMDAGKSTLINSSIMAINGKPGCLEYALRGERGNKSCTLALRSYKVVCNSKNHSDKDVEKNVKFSVGECVPVFWELPGVEKASSAKIQRILKKLYRGGLYHGAEMKLMQSRISYFRTDKKIHLIVFVHPITKELPVKLMDGIYKSVKTMRKGRGPEVPIVVVLTKKDLKPAEDPNPFITEISEKLQVTPEKCFHLSLYCFQTTKERNLPRKKELDCELRKFWDCIIDLRVGRVS